MEVTCDQCGTVGRQTQMSPHLKCAAKHKLELSLVRKEKDLRIGQLESEIRILQGELRRYRVEGRGDREQAVEEEKKDSAEGGFNTWLVEVERYGAYKLDAE